MNLHKVIDFLFCPLMYISITCILFDHEIEKVSMSAFLITLSLFYAYRYNKHVILFKITAISILHIYSLTLIMVIIMICAYLERKQALIDNIFLLSFSVALYLYKDKTLIIMIAAYIMVKTVFIMAKMIVKITF